MSKLEIGQKASRVLKFLIGVRHPQAAQALVQYGFSQEHLEDGWDRLREVTRIRLAADPMASKPDPMAVEAIDEFENIWFVVTGAVLQNRFPAVHEAFFEKLKQGTGNDVAVTVGTFLSRLRQLEEGEGIYATDGPEARDVLRERGLTDDVIKEISAHVQKLRSWIEPPQEPTSIEKRKESEAHMWAWYREWSAIARIGVKDRRLLRAMGFLSNGKRSAREPDEVIVVDESPAATPEPGQVELTGEDLAQLEGSEAPALPAIATTDGDPALGKEEPSAAE